MNTIIQQGDFNKIEQSLQGSKMEFSVVQKGDGHELIQTESGNGIGYSVTQNGPGTKIKINQGHRNSR